MVVPAQVLQPLGRFFQFSWTNSKVTLVGFCGDLYKKYIPVVVDTTDVDLSNGTLICYLNDIPLINLGNNYLVSTTQYHSFFVSIHDVDKYHGTKQYIHDV